MIASNVSAKTLKAAAIKVGVNIEIKTLSNTGMRHQVKINLGRNRAYQRLSKFHQDRRVHAVCWHGFRDYFRAVYAIEPNARFKTVIDHWRGNVDFENRFEESGNTAAGPPINPIAWRDICNCER